MNFMKTDRQKQVEDYAYAIYNRYYNYLYFNSFKEDFVLKKFKDVEIVDQYAIDMAIIAMKTALSFNIDTDKKTVMKYGGFIIEVIAELKTYKDEV